MNSHQILLIGSLVLPWSDWQHSKQFAVNIMAQTMILSQDFKEFIESLNANQVRYLVVGGYAVAIHGHPRYTKDMDVWIDATAENANRVVAALDQFGFSSLKLTA